MKFPLHLSFTIISLAQKITVTDADGAMICYVRQKIFKFKEAIEVFTDKKRAAKICDIKADRIIDFSATYHFFDSKGKEFGAVARKGVKSIYRAHYEILTSGKPDLVINEEKPLIKMLDGFISGIPVVGLFTGLFLNPSYIIVHSQTGKELIRITKCKALFESKFMIEKLTDFDSEDELRILIATIMMVLLEKNRG